MLTPPLHDTGGVQAVSRQVSQSLSDSGFCVEVVERTPGRIGALAFLLRTIARAYHGRHDIFLATHANLSPLFLLPMLPGCPRRVVLAHGREVWGQLDKRVLLGLRRAYRVWSVSRFTDERLRRIHGVPSFQIRRLVLGVAVPSATEDARTRGSGPGKSGKRLISVGRLTVSTMYKGFDTLISALPGVLSNHPGVRLIIVGDGDGADVLKALAQELGVSGFVDFVGAVTDEALDDYWRQSDIFVLPCRFEDGPPPGGEGLGLVILEASARGLPVIVGDSAGARDAVIPGVTGIAVDPTTTATEKAILELLGDSELALRMGERGRSFVQSDRDGAAFRKSLQGLIVDVLG